MTALLLGASGLTGGYCLQELLNENQFDKIIALSRKPLNMNHPKLEQIITDFSDLTNLKSTLKAEVVFCCLGTTIKKAGSKEKFKQIDFEYPLRVAQIAKENGTHTFALVSAMGADTYSLFFYSRVKGELEQALKNLSFPSLIILQPSLLLGDRKEKRIGEDIGKVISAVLGFLIPAKYKAIHAQQVAKAMVKLSLQGLSGTIIKENDEIKKV
ncbi:oxidoreductase [Thermoflexibacter ruber]|uniref:NAD(P)H-binding n=1 Tax=Thermoflexibacter ruber TaxID=1003 RepID=A0A1I2JLQ4_9BACT|nr:oxidoreductase [Thermoflexibacter ruber]SFF54813.1 NAD(P)H-binding [Thermoflexibacter ruber]